MPIIKNLNKLQKQKADTKLHPRGRKYKQLTTAELRQNKLTNLKSQRNETQERKLERHKFVKDICSNLAKPQYSMDELRVMCQEFIDRNKPELEKLAKERRPGRPPTNRHQNVQLIYDIETKEFVEGFTIVDITDPATVKHLEEWNGSWGGLNMLKMTRVKRDSK